VSLGVTDGTVTQGLTGSSSWQLGSTTNAYGGSVGTVYSSTTYMGNQKAVGLTTDETKSGIIVEPDTNIKLVIKY